METVTLSSKYQLVLPRGARERLQLRPGMRITVVDKGAAYIEGRRPLLVCAIELHEVYKVIRRDIGEERAVDAVSALRRATIAPVDESSRWRRPIFLWPTASRWLTRSSTPPPGGSGRRW